MRIIFDVETYPDVFTLAAECADAPFKWSFEISPWRDDSIALWDWLQWCRAEDHELVGFNNVGFDYPVLHVFVRMQGRATAPMLYAKAMEIIKSQDNDRFSNVVYPNDRFVKQLDLFKIHHFDNRSKSTSLKALEFNMKMDNVADLPFPVGTRLDPEQIKILRHYNAHDVTATKRFYGASLDMIQFREDLARQYGKDFTNHNDTKIGAEIFQIALEAAGVQCYEYGPDGRQPRQTKRPSINLAECIPSYINLHEPEFRRVRDYLASQTITETRGAFELSATVGGLEFVFGTGGIHASVENRHFISNDDWVILDIDVAGMYPAIAIANGYYPEHLGPAFVEVYKQIRDQRAKYKKGTPQNAALKLAGNGVYGKSNDQYSIFFDPKFTMKVTLTGQLSLAMLVEQLLGVWGVKFIQANTDGLTMYVPRRVLPEIELVIKHWEKLTGLTMESVFYDKMFIRDVNSYIALKENGDIKRIGAYDYVKDWHQDQSCLVVQKVAEQVLLYGAPVRETIESWPDLYDFMLRVKVPRSSSLHCVSEAGEYKLQNMTRYFVSVGGVALVKVMPPLAKKPGVWRRIGVESGWTVCPCNDIKDATLPVNFDYYVDQVEKLTLGMR